jgi:hypothetical protein
MLNFFRYEDRNNSHLMLKRILFISLFFTLLLNCSIAEQPKFVGLKNIKVVNATLQTMTLRADALFINPNDVGGILKADNLKVYINATEVATIVSDEFDVPSKKAFKIPLTTVIANDSLMHKKSLGGFLGSLISQRLKVQIKGTIKYKILGYSSTYSIDETQEIKIKF